MSGANGPGTGLGVRGADVNERVPAGPLWWTALGVGGLVMAYGVYGLLANLLPAERPHWLLWFAGLLLVHDLLVVPAVLGVAVTLRKVLSGRTLALVQAGAIVSAVVTLAALPALTGYGRATQPNNATVLPLNYTVNLLLVVVAVWAVVGVALAVTRARRA